MKEILYTEIPRPDTNQVKNWLQQQWQPKLGVKKITPDGIRIQLSTDSNIENELSIFIWSLQRTTYLKIFLWGDNLNLGVSQIKQQLITDINQEFPPQYPIPPEIDLSQQSIFEALADVYPQTVHFFQKMPNGEYDLNRVYWWEKRWRESVRNPQQPKQVIFKNKNPVTTTVNNYDLIYIGGALGVIHGAVMAQKGYRVLLVERLPFGRMNREWNISRDEFQSLINLGLFTAKEFEEVIAAEYVDGFSKFF